MPVVFFSVCTWYGNCTMPHVLKSVFGKKEKLLAKKTCRDMCFTYQCRQGKKLSGAHEQFVLGIYSILSTSS